MSVCIVKGCIHIKNIPLFSFPKNEEKLKEWERRIFPTDDATKSKEGDKICIRHFEKRFIEKNFLLPNAVPSLFLGGSTIDDFEELLSAQKQQPSKKKRGSSGLRNLQIAREKRNLRKERMKKIAEMRRLTKLQNSIYNRDEEKVESKPQVYDVSKDYFLGDREETEHEKVLISLRLPQHLHDAKLKHPSSIRHVQNFPLFNSIKHMEKLIDNNPVFWDTNDAISFIQHFIPLKNIIKRFQVHEVTGETILNLTKNDLINYLQIDTKNAEVLSEKFDQLRRETIARYISI